MKYYLFFLFLLSCLTSFGQDTERDKIRQLEQQKEFERARAIRAQMDSAIYFLDHEEYDLADQKFRYALSNMKSIPSDLTFYFGKNSFYFGKFKQSVDWLTKYIQLKGTSGQFSGEAVEILKKAEVALVQEHQVATQKASEVLSQDYTIDCGPAGKVTCPVCNGSTVIIRKDYFGETYKTCNYCNHMGFLSCEDYNKLIRGQLKPTANK